MKEDLVLLLESVVEHTVLDLIAPTVVALAILALIQVAAQEYVLMVFGMIVKQKPLRKSEGFLFILYLIISSEQQLRGALCLPSIPRKHRLRLRCS